MKILIDDLPRRVVQIKQYNTNKTLNIAIIQFCNQFFDNLFSMCIPPEVEPEVTLPTLEIDYLKH